MVEFFGDDCLNTVMPNAFIVWGFYWGDAEYRSNATALSSDLLKCQRNLHLTARK